MSIKKLIVQSKKRQTGRRWDVFARGFPKRRTGLLELQGLAFSGRLIDRFEERYGAAAFASIYG